MLFDTCLNGCTCHVSDRSLLSTNKVSKRKLSIVWRLIVQPLIHGSKTKRSFFENFQCETKVSVEYQTYLYSEHLCTVSQCMRPPTITIFSFFKLFSFFYNLLICFEYRYSNTVYQFWYTIVKKITLWSAFYITFGVNIITLVKHNYGFRI